MRAKHALHLNFTEHPTLPQTGLQLSVGHASPGHFTVHIMPAHVVAWLFQLL